MGKNEEMNDKITMRDALENPIWLMVYEGEPYRKIDVTMSYIELKAIYDMVNAKRMSEARNERGKRNRP